MKTLLLLRGSCGCGKSTFIKNNHLENYCLSADDIRIMFQSPILNKDGKYEISQKFNKDVWKLLFSILENRMKLGEFTVIDATNSTTSEMVKYKDLCALYRYRIFCVDFTDIPIEIVKERNKQREECKVVSDEVIEKMYDRFKTQKIPSGISVIKEDEIDKVWVKPIDLSSYKKIHHIGDIHGCNTALQNYLSNNGGLKDDEFYIFLGDYIDRGNENVEVIKFLINIKDKSNVLLLEGNHETHLSKYAKGLMSSSDIFNNYTRYELDNGCISKKDIRNLCRKFAQCAYYKYNEKTIIVTHGGISKIPQNITLLSTSQMIKGCGLYSESHDCDVAFCKNTSDNVFQIHGHRNIQSMPIHNTNKTFNLEGSVEFGEYLRCVQLSQKGFKTVETKNNIFKHDKIKTIDDNDISSLVKSLRENEYIKEKIFDNISSFNFNEKAFYNKVWNERTVKARGLYIDTKENKIIARGYNKFFNIDEGEENNLSNLHKKIVFPIKMYVKENGFLAMVSYNPYTDGLFISTKSTINGEYSKYFTDIFNKTVDCKKQNQILDFVKNSNVTLLFECIDTQNDPHIIKYDSDKIVLLDIIDNNIQFSKWEYMNVVEFGNNFGISTKKLAYTANSWNDFLSIYKEVTQNNYKYNNDFIEGFVIEDSNGYLTKLKLNYYCFWKYLRGITYNVCKYGEISNTKKLKTTAVVNYYHWILNLKRNNQLTDNFNICELREKYETTEGEKYEKVF